MDPRAVASGDKLPADRFHAEPLRWVDTGTARVAYRVFGQGGAPLVFIHGWPLHGFTYRKLLPYLQERFTCYLLDTPGLGESEWSTATDFAFPAQAANFRRVIDGLGLESYAVVAHDTGATIARYLARLDERRMRKLAIINTEIPFHKPPWIPLYRHTLALPGSAAVLRALLRSDTYLRSGAGFGGCFVDQALLGGDFKRYFVAPLIESPRRTAGAIRYIRGLQWRDVDALAAEHQRMMLPVQLIWGADDPTFPEPLARRMSAQLANCVGFTSIAGARLLPHEEKPTAVAGALRAFLDG
jgi:pimeloyl-ACP methyl ester carboxylesterase